jgi:hypothetical protein
VKTLGIASVGLTGLDMTSGSLLVPLFTRVLCPGCLPLWAGVCHSYRDWSLLKNRKNLGHFGTLTVGKSPCRISSLLRRISSGRLPVTWEHLFVRQDL